VQRIRARLAPIGGDRRLNTASRAVAQLACP
jgi:hypothetical protein